MPTQSAWISIFTEEVWQDPLSPTLGLCGWRNHSSRAPTPRVGRMIAFLESAYGPSAHTENELLYPKIEHGNQEGESCRFSLSAFVPT